MFFVGVGVGVEDATPTGEVGVIVKVVVAVGKMDASKVAVIARFTV